MVEITEPYVLTGPGGPASLLDLFAGRRQLIVGHMMFEPAAEEACQSCSAGADEISEGLLRHLATRDTSYAAVSRAPIEKIEAYKAKRGWTFPWYSSHGSGFNHDFGVTLDPARPPILYNYREIPADELGDGPSEVPGTSVFLRDGDRVFHTYSSFARGAEATGGSYYFLDLTALGRQEDWEEPKDRSADVRGAVPNFSS
jgi:predicted dithiol-disulfide oxidoreductase (DUF899 family)